MDNTVSGLSRLAEYEGAHLDDVSSVVVEIPQLAVVLLMRPPERVGARGRVDLALLPHTPPDVECKCVAVLLKQRVDAGDTAVPRILKILLQAIGGPVMFLLFAP